MAALCFACCASLHEVRPKSKHPFGVSSFLCAIVNGFVVRKSGDAWMCPIKDLRMFFWCAVERGEVAGEVVKERDAASAQDSIRVCQQVTDSQTLTEGHQKQGTWCAIVRLEPAVVLIRGTGCLGGHDWTITTGGGAKGNKNRACRVVRHGALSRSSTAVVRAQAFAWTSERGATNCYS